MADEELRQRVLHYAGHCKQLLAEVDEQPGFVKGSALVLKARSVASESLKLMHDLLKAAESGAGGSDGE